MSSSTHKTSPLSHLALSESGFLFDPVTGLTFTLNPTGTLLLRALIDGARVEELPGRLAEAFEVEQEDAQQDIAEFLSQLRELGLVPEEIDRG